MCKSCRKLDLRFLLNKTETFLASVTHLILRFAIVQNKFQQTNRTKICKINHINDNYIKFNVSLHFLGIWPIVRHCVGRYVLNDGQHLLKQSDLKFDCLFMSQLMPASTSQRAASHSTMLPHYKHKTNVPVIT